MQALGSIGDVRAVEPLIVDLSDENSKVCKATIEALGDIGNEKAVQPLIKVLKAPRYLHSTLGIDYLEFKWDEISTVAAHALGKIGDPDAVSHLIALDNDEKAHEVIVSVLTNFGDAAVKPLIEALKNKDVSIKAGKALVPIGEPAVEPLVAVLKDGTVAEKESAADALGSIGDARAVEPLVDCLDTVPRSAAFALEKLDWCPTQDEAGAWYWIGHREWDRCVQIGTLAVMPLIMTLKNEDEHLCQEEAAAALGLIGDARAVEPLVDCLDTVPRSAAFALEKLDWRPTQDEAGAWYWIGQEEWDKCVQIGTSAVLPLVITLEDMIAKTYRTITVEVAKALVNLYQSVELSDDLKSFILDQRDAIQSHTDQTCKKHTDGPYLSALGSCGYEDYQYSVHTDEGIGVDFPL